MARKISPRDFGMNQGPALSPGQIYRGITTISEDFEGETKSVIEPDPEFVKYCKKMRTRFPEFAKNANFPEKHAEAVRFLGWRLSAGDFYAAIKGSFVLALIPAVIFLILAFIFGVGIEIGTFSTSDILGMTPLFVELFDSDLAILVFFTFVLMVFSIIGLFVYSIYNTPLVAAEDEKNKALTYVPEMIGYMIMSMKLVPNLEKAIEFSAKHGRGKVATDFKRLIWDFQIGVYGSVSEGLDALAYRWGVYSSELKESLMKIRASVMEPIESNRYQLLDKTMLEVLNSVKTKMEDYARSLNQPSIMLFYLGILLPLILIIVLPVGSAFSGAPFSQPIVLIMIYCVILPFVAFSFAKRVIQKRPPTYEPPIINDDYPELPKKWQMILGGSKFDARVGAIGILIIGFLVSLFISLQGIPPIMLLDNSDPYLPPIQFLSSDKSLGELLISDAGGSRGEDYFGKVTNLIFFDYIVIEEGTRYKELTITDGKTPQEAKAIINSEYLKFVSDPKTDPSRLILLSGMILTITLSACFLLYYRNIYRRKSQLAIMSMEDEFKESMYVIASRMGENKPVENALKSAKNFLPNLVISQRIFGKTVENIELMGLSLENAIFDPIYGSMKNIPSKTLDTAMRLLVDSVNLGVEVASRTLMSLSLQMENMDKVNKSLKDMVSDVTATMTTMAIFIGPMVLGITVALQKVVMTTLANVVSDSTFENASSLDNAAIVDITGGSSMINVDSLFKITPDTFQTFATPTMFFFIIAIYVIEIVIILLYFTTKIKEDNDLLFRINLATSLPIAVAVFVITVVISNTAISLVMAGG